jgi:hypothetical protein
MAVQLREQSIREGWSRRTDLDAVRASIAIFRGFLGSYPVADDARVEAFCRKHITHLGRVLMPSAKPKVLQRLLTEGLNVREQIGQVQDQIRRSGNDIVQLTMGLDVRSAADEDAPVIRREPSK